MTNNIIQLDNNLQPEQTAYDTVFSALMNYSVPELKKMFTEVLAHKRQSIKSQLKVGTKVYVLSKDYRKPGVINRVNIKRCIVEIDGKLWDVPLQNIEIATDHEYYPHA